MATVTETSKLDVIAKYKELIKVSTDADSLYIKAKETLEQMYKDNDVPQDSKGEVLGQLISSLHTSVMSTSMNTALAWAAKEKDIALRKLELEKQLDVLTNNIAQSEAEAERVRVANLIQQAESLRQHGTMIVANEKVVGLSAEGIQYQNIELTKEKIESEKKAQNLSDAKLKESYAGINKLVADTYVNYGMFTGYTIAENGITGVTNVTPTGWKTLSNAQLTIAQQQAKGYAWNVWSNVATGLGSTIGVALTSETDIFTGDNSGILTQWKDVITKMNQIQPPSF